MVKFRKIQKKWVRGRIDLSFWEGRRFQHEGDTKKEKTKAGKGKKKK